eukprot:jgi/Chlat1/3209/Chrsp22S03493
MLSLRRPSPSSLTRAWLSAGCVAACGLLFGVAWGEVVVKPGSGDTLRLPTSKLDYSTPLSEKFKARVAWNDGFFFLVLLCIYPTIRHILCKDVFEPLGQYFLGIKKKDDNVKAEHGAADRKMVKWNDESWKFSYYLFTSCYALLVVYKEPWFTDTTHFWIGAPTQALSPQLKYLYFVETAYYAYSAFAVAFVEDKKKDYWVMITHHVVTFGLLSYSYLEGLFRIGSMVILLHDTCDVFLGAAKLANLAKWETLVQGLFGVFLASWILLRLIYFPFWILWSTSIQSVEMLHLTKPYPRQYYEFNVMLSVLMVLNLYWFYLIMRMVQRQLLAAGKINKDIRLLNGCTAAVHIVSYAVVCLV